VQTEILVGPQAKCPLFFRNLTKIEYSMHMVKQMG